MNAPIHPVQSAADVLAMLADADLPMLRKRDLTSAHKPRLPDGRLLACRPAAAGA